jgi:uncharacterized membrane protein
MKSISTAVSSNALALAHANPNAACLRYLSKHTACGLGWLLVVVGLLSPTAGQARELVTFQFGGVVTDSSSAEVAVGDRFRGMFTYDLDAVDENPDSNSVGAYYFEMPEAQPIGMQYAVGTLSHRTGILADLLIFNDTFPGEDWFVFGSDAFSGPTLTPSHGSLALIDDTMTAFDSDRPPLTLDLARFSFVRFEGSDGSLEGQFGGDVDELRLVPSPNGQPGFLGLGFLRSEPEFNYSHARAVSPDGSTVVGIARNPTGESGSPQAWRWTLGPGMVGLGQTTGVFHHGTANGVSSHGDVVVGEYDFAALWMDNGEPILLESGPHGFLAERANDVTADGTVVVGLMGFPSGAFRWTSSSGFEVLESESLDGASEALAVSDDGAVVVGKAQPESGVSVVPFRWTADTGMVSLNGRVRGEAHDVTGDGAVIVGNTQTSNGFEAFRWTESSGIMPLGDLPGGGVNGSASAVGAGGNAIVGLSSTGFGGPNGPVFEAFIWTPSGGIRNLRDALIGDFGFASALAGWQLTHATGISADGRVIVGYGINPAGQDEAWLAVLPPPEPLVLTVSFSDGAVVLSWPESDPPAVLERTVHLTPLAWSPVMTEASQANGMITVILPATGSDGFFRLRESSETETAAYQEQSFRTTPATGSRESTSTGVGSPGRRGAASQDPGRHQPDVARAQDHH